MPGLLTGRPLDWPVSRLAGLSAGRSLGRPRVAHFYRTVTGNRVQSRTAATNKREIPDIPNFMIS
ncbi:MAG: hypothetical protein JW829_09370 [Pirellulales bacterium]|nr:hypothetical protein [Pirellulales bacterium]